MEQVRCLAFDVFVKIIKRWVHCIETFAAVYAYVAYTDSGRGNGAAWDAFSLLGMDDGR